MQSLLLLSDSGYDLAPVTTKTRNRKWHQNSAISVWLNVIKKWQQSGCCWTCITENTAHVTWPLYCYYDSPQPQIPLHPSWKLPQCSV